MQIMKRPLREAKLGPLCFYYSWTKQTPSDLFFKIDGIGHPKRTRQKEKVKEPTRLSVLREKKHVTTRWKQGRWNGGSDWFSCPFLSGSLWRPWITWGKQREGDAHKERKLRNTESDREEERRAAIIKKETLWPTLSSDFNSPPFHLPVFKF